jgi:hypothetical protein
MKFTVDVKEFSNNLKLIQSVVAASASASTTAVVLKKSGLWAYAGTDTGTLKCKLKGVSDFEGSGIAGLDFSLMDKMLKGRDKIVFENKDTMFKFKAQKGPYNGDVAIIPVTKESIEAYDETLAKSKKAKTASLDVDTFSALRASLAITNISMIHASDVLNTFIRLQDGTLEVVGSDNFHLAYSKVACKTKTAFQISPTKATFDTLGKLADFYGGQTDVEFATEAIKAFNEDYTISSPTIQSSDTAFIRVLEYIEQMPKPMCSFTIGIGNTISALDNILSIYEDGALITLELKSGKKGGEVLEFTMKTTMGTITDNFKIETLKGKHFKCTFDPRMLLDSLNLAKSTEAKFSYIEDKAIVLKVVKVDKETKTSTEITYVNSVVKD